jgi:UDP-glucose 4-epimerase
VAIFAQRLLQGEPIQINARKQSGDAGCVRDYVFVADVVKANLAAIEGKLQKSPLNVCTGEATSTLELAHLMARAAGVTATLGHGARREGDVERSVLDPGEPAPLGASLSLADGVARTIAWFRQRAS